MEPREFTCAMCGGTFEQGWTDEEAEAEYTSAFTELSKEQKEDRAEVCDDCYSAFVPGDGRSRAASSGPRLRPRRRIFRCILNLLWR